MPPWQQELEQSETGDFYGSELKKKERNWIEDIIYKNTALAKWFKCL